MQSRSYIGSSPNPQASSKPCADTREGVGAPVQRESARRERRGCRDLVAHALTRTRPHPDGAVITVSCGACRDFGVVCRDLGSIFAVSDELALKAGAGNAQQLVGACLGAFGSLHGPADDLFLEAMEELGERDAGDAVEVQGEER